MLTVSIDYGNNTKELSSTRKRSLEVHGENGSKKEKKKLKLEKTEPKLEADEAQHKMIMEFKSQGQKLTEKVKSKKVLLKKLQKLRKMGDGSKSDVDTSKKMEPKEEIKTELSLDTVVTYSGQISKTGESSLKTREVGKVTQEYKKKTSQTEGCINKDDVEWYQENISDVFNQLIRDLLQDTPLHVLVERFMSEIHKSMQHIKLQPEIGLAEIQDIVNTIADKEGTALKSML